jgi:eukaryotic-like serine/threonine-protein kinase
VLAHGRIGAAPTSVAPSGEFGIVRAAVTEEVKDWPASEIDGDAIKAPPLAGPTADGNVGLAGADGTHPQRSVVRLAGPDSPTRTSSRLEINGVGAESARPDGPEIDDRLPAPLQYRDPGRYEILDEHGRGGLGRVLRARDRELGRTVALKELLHRGNSSEVRFFREALVTARLEHPGIVPVHEAGRWPDGTPFYAMKLVAGRPLGILIAEAATYDDRIALLPHVIAVADALAYAHKRGIIHRDLKPSNVIVGDYGETVVIDWGLAKDLADEEDTESLDTPPVAGPESITVTRAGTILGTPAYMSPEQAWGKPANRRSDVYALGALALTVATGRPPYAHSNPDEIIQELKTGTQIDLRACTEGVPDDLIAIIEKAMSTAPSHRYSTAKEFGDELRRFCRGQIVLAHNYSYRQRAARLLTRHRSVVFTASLLSLALLLSLAYGFRRVLNEKAVADNHRNRAVEALGNEHAEHNRLILTQAGTMLDVDATEALFWLSQYEGSNTEAVQRIAALATTTSCEGAAFIPGGPIVLTRPIRQDLFLAVGARHSVWVGDLHDKPHKITTSLSAFNALDISPDSRRVAYVTSTNELRIFSFADSSDSVVETFDRPVRRVEFSRDGSYLLSQHDDGLRLWRTSSWTIERVLPCTQDFAIFAPDSKGILCTTSRKTVSAFDLQGTILLRIPELNLGAYYSVSTELNAVLFISSSGDYVAYNADTHHYTIHDSSVNCAPRRLTDLASGDLSLAECDDGSFVLHGLADGQTAQLTGPRTDRPLATLSPDGGLAAVSNVDGSITLIQINSNLTRTLIGHAGTIRNLSFSRDSAELISAGTDGTIRLWDCKKGWPRQLFRRPDAVFRALPSPNGRYLASDGRDGTVTLLDLHSGIEHSLVGHQGIAFGLDYSRDDQSLASASWDGSVRVWSLASLSSFMLRSHRGIVRDVKFSPNGELIATAGEDGAVKLWSRDGALLKTMVGHQDEIYRIAFFADGRHLASVSADATVRVWDIQTGTSTPRSGHEGPVMRVLVVPNSSLFVTSGDDGRLLLWDLNSRTRLAELFSAGVSAPALAVSPKGRFVAIGFDDGRVAIMDLFTRVFIVYTEHSARVVGISFSDEGREIASAGEDQTVHVRDLSTGRLTILRHDEKVASATFTRDSQDVVTTTESGRVLLWQSPLRSTDAVPASDLERWLSAAVQRFSPDFINRPSVERKQ